MNNSRLTKIIFNWDMRLQEQGYNNWSNDMCQEFHKLSCHDIFVSKNVCCLSTVSEKLDALASSAWQAGLPSKPKLRTYSLIKTEFATESYVYNLYPRSQRSLMAQFRIGVLPLRVETGRYTRLALEDRTCQLCNSQNIEDEIHFLCECSCYDTLRESLYGTVNLTGEFTHMDRVNKFKFLMSFQKPISKYLESAWYKRKQMLYH